MTALSLVSKPATAVPAVIVKRDERTVRLADLAVARENARFDSPPDDDIPTLAAALKAAGQLYPLTVRPGRGKREKTWMALDGRRRLLAFANLVQSGDIDGEYPVKIYVETDPARQAAAVLLTNSAVPLHVADVIAAIGRMQRSKLSLPAIARALGHDEIGIKRLAALAALPSAALMALKSGRLTLKQARLLARLPDRDEQRTLAEAAMNGHGFQDWRILERLDEARVTLRDPRCALVDPATYATAGGRMEVDLFGELAPILLDPDLLTTAWTARVRSIAAVFEADGIAVHVTVGPEPDVPDDLEALGYVYGGALPGDEMARYRAQREVFNDKAEAVRSAIAARAAQADVDAAIVAMIQARVISDQTGGGGRRATSLVLWPASGTGVEIRCYTSEAPADLQGSLTDEDAREPVASRLSAPAAYTPPEVSFQPPEIDGVNHALHAVRTDVATRGLIRALADDPGAALTALISRLFNVLVVQRHTRPSDSALALSATGFNPSGGRVIEALDGDVRQRLDARRAVWQATGATVIAWVHGLAHGDKMALLAELTAISLDVRETRTDLIRSSARAEATELAALCGADITLYWTPDATFLQSHPKALLIDLLDAMGSEDDCAKSLKKSELVDWVAQQAAVRTWAPPSLSWRMAEADAVDTDDVKGLEGEGEGEGDATSSDAAGAFVVTPEGVAALDGAAA